MILSLFVIFGFICSVFSQTKISGVINKYGRVTSIGTDYVVVNDEAQFDQFSVGDTVLLIQMKGVRIYSTEAPQYGTPESSYGPSGMHEFLMIESVDDGTNTIVFRNNIVNSTFNVDGAVQIIKVPSYNNALVDVSLSSQAWDSASKTGGVVSAIVGNTLSLNGNIDVSGKGFIGGSPVLGPGICVSTNFLRYDKYSFHRDSLNSGFKGEGPVTRGWLDLSTFPLIYPAYAKGKGANFTGGGGGNGRFSGGGGGANYGAGGKGGREMATCTGPVDGGLGGRQIQSPLIGGMFLGGGGGSSTYSAGSTASSGGNGGGMVIIVCDTLKGNSRSILAAGVGASAATGANAGAGGGGAGGTVALYLRSWSTSNLTISANGGKGGNNPGTYGEGGGGGGGFITTSNITAPANVTKTLTGGVVGTRVGGSTGSNGAVGVNLTSFVPVLNGFLFNSIRSSITGDQTDSICSNIIPKTITGTSPVGGSGTYTYLWQKSYNLSGPASNIPSSNVTDYTPTAVEPAGNVWFRRVVKDDVTLLTDTSKWVRIIVQPAITGNLVGKDTVICYGQNPLNLVPLNAGPSNGNGIYSYQWLQNLTNTNWTTSPDASGTSTLASYDPPSLITTTYFQRLVTSGRCIDYSSTVTVTVLPLITGNITSRPDSVICEGSVFIPLGATAAGGGAGAGSYTYQWQDSAASVTGNWLPASGINTGQTHSPDTSKFTVTDTLRYFRRVIFSGPDNVCKSYSSPIRLTRYARIINNSISADNTICSGTIPVPLSGTSPQQGSLIYTYIWQDSIRNGSWTARGTINSLPFITGLTDTTWYRRTVNSSKCTNTSNILVINVHKPITNNTISLKSGLTDSTICSGAIPNKIIGLIPPVLTGGDGSGYTYKWKYSTDNSIWTDVPAVNTFDYQPPTLTSTAISATWYKRVTASGVCKDSLNSVRINVLPPVVNTIPADKAVCINTESMPIVGLTLSGGMTNQYKFLWESSPDGSTWTDVTTDTIRTISGADLQLPLLSTPVIYRRKVWSGPYNTCFSISNPVNVIIDNLPYPVFAGKDTLLQSFEYLYKLRASEPILGTGTWSPDSYAFDNRSLCNTVVRNLSSGPNVLTWKVVNGVCELESIVKVEILDLKVPEGISPDGNGKNDILTIRGLDFSLDETSGKPNQLIELTILNSAGTQVFFTSNTSGSEWKYWDGTNSSGAELPEGTYYYLLKITSNRTDGLYKRTGFIILKRY